MDVRPPPHPRDGRGQRLLQARLVLQGLLSFIYGLPPHRPHHKICQIFGILTVLQVRRFHNLQRVRPLSIQKGQRKNHSDRNNFRNRHIDAYFPQHQASFSN